jgi:predicted transposase/invertase (TIGR01784 family)
MALNKQYKDSVFSLLFGEPDILRELYGAICGVPLDPSIPITINTLEGVLFMERINDISFEIADKLVVLLEHQSTINPNMAIRLLMYIARIYEKIIDNKKIYSRRRIAIPRPEFIVLYNGTAPYPDESTLRLSESFEEGDWWSGAADLELVVKVYNINEGHNEAIVRRCERLKGYSEFIGKVRELERSGREKETAMKEAIEYCIGHGILREFLKEKSSEVINMLLTEWNWEDALEVRWEEGREEGLEQGLEQGRRETARNLKEMGLSVDQIAAGTGLDPDLIRTL